MRPIDEDEVIKFYKNMGKEFPELSVGVHFSINDIINNLNNIDTVKNVHLGGKTAMNKYSDIEIQTAKNLLKAGYKWIVRETYGGLYAYKDKPHKNSNRNYSDDTLQCDGRYLGICTKYVPIFQSITCDDTEPTSLESIVYPQILDDVEKRYLKGVIGPFRSRIYFIEKDIEHDMKREYILISCTDDDIICFPYFKAGTMYKGMETGKEYSLEELGL